MGDEIFFILGKNIFNYLCQFLKIIFTKNKGIWNNWNINVLENMFCKTATLSTETFFQKNV